MTIPTWPNLDQGSWYDLFKSWLDLDWKGYEALRQYQLDQQVSRGLKSIDDLPQPVVQEKFDALLRDHRLDLLQTVIGKDGPDLRAVALGSRLTDVLTNGVPGPALYEVLALRIASDKERDAPPQSEVQRMRSVLQSRTEAREMLRRVYDFFFIEGLYAYDRGILDDPGPMRDDMILEQTIRDDPIYVYLAGTAAKNVPTTGPGATDTKPGAQEISSAASADATPTLTGQQDSGGAPLSTSTRPPLDQESWDALCRSWDTLPSKDEAVVNAYREEIFDKCEKVLETLRHALEDFGIFSAEQIESAEREVAAAMMEPSMGVVSARRAQLCAPNRVRLVQSMVVGEDGPDLSAGGPTGDLIREIGAYASPVGVVYGARALRIASDREKESPSRSQTERLWSIRQSRREALRELEAVCGNHPDFIALRHIEAIALDGPLNADDGTSLGDTEDPIYGALFGTESALTIVPDATGGTLDFDAFWTATFGAEDGPVDDLGTVPPDIGPTAQDPPTTDRRPPEPPNSSPESSPGLG